MVSVLPDDQPVPYPQVLKFLQGITDHLLGMQQTAALKAGLLMAYLGRGIMLVLATWVTSHPSLKILGALYLLKLALDHLGQADEAPSETALIGNSVKVASAMAVFWLVVLNVEVADLVFSLDNVVVAVALSSHLWVVLLGVAIGIVMMRFAAGIFTWLIKREPILVTGAYLVVFNIGLELLLNKFFGIEVPSWLKFVISVGTLLLCILYARWVPLRRLDPLFQRIGKQIGHLNGYLNRILQLALVPFKLILNPLLGRKKSSFEEMEV
jgi:tellurite resistance protein TerC